MDLGFFDGSLPLDLVDLTAQQWASVLIACFREGGLVLAVRIIRLAPAEIAAELSAGLREVCPIIVRPANDA